MVSGKNSEYEYLTGNSIVDGSSGDISEYFVKSGKLGVKQLSLEKLVSLIDKASVEKFIDGYDIKNFARVFEDEELMTTMECFLENGMNVTRTAEKMYMHRNTLSYRLTKLQNLTGLDLRNFSEAVTFKILHVLYQQR